MAQIATELASLDGRVLLAGHSAGGAVLLKYLLKEDIAQSIAGIFLISIPHWDPEDEEGEEYALEKGFASRLPIGVPIFLYHSRDDEWVPFAHLAIYAEKSHRQPSVNSMGVGINLTMIYLKWQQISKAYNLL
jgi:predicted alpha/beta hydrolase family esterase